MLKPSAKCPHCSRNLDHVMIASVIGKQKQPHTMEVPAVLFSCPYCNGILTAQVNPVTIRNEIFAQIEQSHAATAADLQQLKEHVAELTACLEQILQTNPSPNLTASISQQ